MSTKRHQAERGEKLGFWRPHINSFLASELSAKEYCQQHGLVHHQLKYWQYEIAKERTSKLSLAHCPDFVEITPAIQPQTSTSLCGSLEIKTHYGFSIILHGEFTEINLSVLLSAVKKLS